MKLIQLELRKLNWWPYLIGFIGLTLFLLSMMYMIAVSVPMIPSNLPGAPQLETLNDLFMIITIMASACFAIFSSILLSKLIIEAYQAKQVQLLFAYPVTRRMMVGIKLALGCSLAFIATALSLAICLGLFSLGEQFFPLYQTTSLRVSSVVVQMLLTSVMAVSISVIATSMAFKKKSIQVTIISTIILSAVLSNLLQLNNGYLNIVLIGALVLGGFVAIFKIVKQVTEMEVV